MLYRRLESGVGRWEEQYLPPYPLSEFLEFRDASLDLDMADTLDESLSRACEHPPDIRGLAELGEVFRLIGGFPELLSEVPARLEEYETWLLRSQRTLGTDAVERAVYKDIPQTFGIENPLVLERLLYG